MHRPGVGQHALRIACVLACVNCWLLCGCSPTARSPQVAQALRDYELGRFDVAYAALAPLAEKKDENFVLNNARLGSIALADYNLAMAESAFYRAYEVINSVNVNDPGRALAALALSEEAKIWKGEPYERAMVNFYLGIVYYMQKDYQNARAAFENALFKLRDYAEGAKSRDEFQERESDFTIGYLMLAKSWQFLGKPERAKPYFESLARLRPELTQLADEQRHAYSNVLLLVEFGDGPEKILGGDNSVVLIRPTPAEAGPIPRPQVYVDGKAQNLRGLNVPPIDMLELAQQRRWQTFDTIRVMKSVAAMGMLGGAAYSAHRGDDAAAIGLALGALALKATATADTRYWEMIPRTMFIIPLELPPGKHDITVSFGRRYEQTWRDIVAPESGESAYYFRITGTNPGPFTWPPPHLASEQVDGNQRVSRTE